MARLWDPPPLIIDQLVLLPILVGEVLWVVLPSPNRPLELSPQAHKVSSALMARLWDCPQLIIDQSALLPIWIGEVLWIMVPSPNRP